MVWSYWHETDLGVGSLSFVVVIAVLSMWVLVVYWVMVFGTEIHLGVLRLGVLDSVLIFYRVCLI